MKVLPHVLRAVGMVLALGACREGGREAAQVEHTLNRPLFRGPMSLWLTLDPNEAPEERDEGPRFVMDPKDPVVSRLQYWADAIRDRLGESIPADFPRIQVVLDLSYEINAHTYGKPLCFDVSFGDPGAAEEVPGVQIYGGEISDAESILTERCEVPLRPATELAPLIERLNAALDEADPFHGGYPESQKTKILEEKYACRLLLEGKHLGTNGHCPESWKNLRADKVLAVLPTNRIVVNRGILAPLTEEETISVLAHELGHVLHADSFRPEPARHYAFVQAEESFTTEPPHSTSPELEGLAQELADKQVATHYLPLPKEARLHPRAAIPMLFGYMHTLRYGSAFVSDNVLRDVSQEACATPQACKPECRDLEKTYEGSGMSDAYYPMGEMTAADEAAYLKVEGALLQCLSSVRANSSLGRSLFATVTERIYGHHVKVADFATLAEAVSGISEEFRNADAASEALQKEAEAARLGVYTEEQMADDFATEAMARLGLNPDAVASSNLKLWKARGELSEEGPRLVTPESQEWSYERCQKARDDGWQSGGRTLYVPPGLLADTHHSVCYRVFNADAEVKSHGLRELSAATARHPAQAGKSWDELKALLDSME